MTTLDPDEMDEEEFAQHYGRPRSTDEYVEKVRHRLALRQMAAAPVVPGVSGVVVDAATEAKISTLLGVDLAAAVRRLYPNQTLSAWVSKNFGNIEALGRALTKHKAAGSPVALSSHSMSATDANAMIIQLQGR